MDVDYERKLSVRPPSERDLQGWRPPPRPDRGEVEAARTFASPQRRVSARSRGQECVSGWVA